jgi:ComF family protein
MSPISSAICEICGEDLGSGRAPIGNQLCLACAEKRPHFFRAAAYGPYDGELRELIHLLKYEHIEPASRILGRMLAEAIQKLNVDVDSVMVITVPLHRSKRRERGFNQAELIARAALKRYSTRAELSLVALERTRSTVSQIGLTRPQRAENIRGAFRVKHLNRVAGREVLLVDDVLTTGTTANECARVLLKAGAARVWVATVARTLKQNQSFTSNLETGAVAAT